MSAAPEQPAQHATQTHAMQTAFTAHLRDPERARLPDDIEDRRMQIYRDLVFANMESFVSANFPVIRSLYDATAWNSLARDFLREHRCHTPLFPEFGREFLRYLEMRQGAGRDDPPFLLELAHYEWAELALSVDESDIAAIPHDPHGDPLEGIALVSPLACVLGYRFAVHRIGPAFRPAQPPAEPTLLLLVRGRDDQVRFHEINALSAMLIERLQQNTERSGRECIDALLSGYEPSIAQSLRAAGETVLRDLQAREAILGTII